MNYSYKNTEWIKFQGCFIILQHRVCTTKCKLLSPNATHKTKTILYGGVWRSSWEASLPVKEVVLYSGDTAADTFVALAREQQGEQTVVGIVIYYPLGSVQKPHQYHC